MTAVLLDGKALGKRIQRDLAEEARGAASRLGRPPGLGVILVGDNPASQVYVGAKTKAAERCAMRPVDKRLPANAGSAEVLKAIEDFNSREDIDGILLQLPLPKGLDEFRAISAIDPRKDVDGLHPLNQGLLLRGAECFRPCTPRGVMALIDEARKNLGQSADLAGLSAVVVGRSLLVGKPVALMLQERNCTVTMCHSRTKDLPAVCREADILVAAIGRPRIIDSSFVKPGAIVIDVGINRLEDGSLCGDVDFDSVRNVAAALTPAPGGVGPMTITMLLLNTLDSARSKIADKNSGQ